MRGTVSDPRWVTTFIRPERLDAKRLDRIEVDVETGAHAAKELGMSTSSLFMDRVRLEDGTTRTTFPSSSTR